MGLSNAYGMPDSNGGSPKSKTPFDMKQVARVLQAMQSGKDMSEMPWAQGAPYALSGGQPRTWTPGPQPVVPFMPQAQQSGPVTFQPNTMNLGMGPTSPNLAPSMSVAPSIDPGRVPVMPKPSIDPGRYPVLPKPSIDPGRIPMRRPMMNLGMGMVR